MHIILLIKYDPNATPNNTSTAIFYDQWHYIPSSNTIQSLNETAVGIASVTNKCLAVRALPGMVTFPDKLIVCLEKATFPQFSLRIKF